MKRTFRFIIVLVALLGLTMISQAALTGACGHTGHEYECPY